MNLNIIKRASVATILATTSIGLSLAYNLFAGEHTKRQTIDVKVDSTPIERQGTLTTSFAPVIKKVTPSVVNIFTTTKVKEPRFHNGQIPLDNPMFHEFFGNRFGHPGRNLQPQERNGLGSGVIISADGYILTNNHVIKNADEIKVAFSEDKHQYTAKIIGTDPKSDLAVLKIDAKESLPAITFADSTQLEIGDIVLAIGNSFGLGQTVTMGMVSATGRHGNLGLDYENFIQTDAAINPGNSGGALVDATGRLVGINTAILSRSGGNNGIGFAIPANLARSVTESILEHGTVVRGFLGVHIQDLSQELADAFSLENTEGSLVSQVAEGSSASKAGIQAGDIITSFNGTKIKDSNHLKLVVSQTTPGTEIDLEIIRNGTLLTLSSTLDTLDEPARYAQSGFKNKPKEKQLIGVVIRDIDQNLQHRYNIPDHVEGAFITQVQPRSRAAKAGLRHGDIIVEINQEPIQSASDLIDWLDQSNAKTFLTRIWRKGGYLYIVIDEDNHG